MNIIRKHFNESAESYIVVNNFESTTEKYCMRMDDKNERIYNIMLTKVEKANKTLGNSVLCVNIEVPLPPRPTNRDRLLLWRKRNIAKPVIEQSAAILFLETNGYKLNQDYEAYQAIDLAKEIKKNEGIVELPITTDFDNVYTHKDNNILRRRSFIHMNRRVETHGAILTETHGSEPKTPKPCAPSAPSEHQLLKPSAPPLTHNIIYPSLDSKHGAAEV
jgi:hypothetical protein